MGKEKIKASTVKNNEGLYEIKTLQAQHDVVMALI